MLRAKLMQACGEAEPIHESENYLKDINKCKDLLLEHNSIILKLTEENKELRDMNERNLKEMENIRSEIFEKNKVAEEFEAKNKDLIKTTEKQIFELFNELKLLKAELLFNEEGFKLKLCKTVIEKDEILKEMNINIENLKKNVKLYEDRIKTLESSLQTRDEFISTLSSENSAYQGKIADIQNLTDEEINYLKKENKALGLSCIKIKEELEVLTKVHESCEKEKVGYNKYIKIEQELLETKKTFTEVFQNFSNFKEFIIENMNSLINSIENLRNSETKAEIKHFNANNFDFQEIKEVIGLILQENTSLINTTQSLQQKISKSQ